MAGWMSAVACKVARTAVPIALWSWSHRVCSDRRRPCVVSLASSPAIVASSSEPIVISGTGPDSSVGGTPFTRPTPWSGEPVGAACRPAGSASRSLALEPGCASSTSSIAEKWERLAERQTRGVDRRRACRTVHTDVSGASLGCSPNDAVGRPASSWSCRDRDGGPGVCSSRGRRTAPPATGRRRLRAARARRARTTPGSATTPRPTPWRSRP